jgi:type III pantothenate kinase
MSNLAVDIGNTRTKLGLFSKDSALMTVSQHEDFDFDKVLTTATNHAVEKIIFSSVGHQLTDEQTVILGRHFYWLELDTRTPLPIQNHYLTPSTLGKDRLAAVVGASELYPGENCLVIDAGTCITYDLLEAGRHYRGGNIAPGLQMRYQAMHTFTQRLPLVDVTAEDGWLGNTTETALQRGGLLGVTFEIEGYLAHCAAQFGKIRGVLTGGDADFLAKQVKSKIFVHRNLVLTGLNKILNYNVELTD